LPEALGVRFAEFYEAVGRPEVEQLGTGALGGEHGAFGMAVPSEYPAVEDALEHAFVRDGEALGPGEQSAEGNAPRVAGALEELGELQGGRGIGMEKIGPEPLDRGEVLGQTLLGQVIAGEHQPVARRVVADD